MSLSSSFKTPMASFSAAELTINMSQAVESRESSYSSVATSAMRQNRAISSGSSHITTVDRIGIQADDEDEASRLLSQRYENNRMKQEKLLLFANIFRVLIICVFAPVIYFLI
ncbi:unnamed protein product [Adineta ricciae]|uniref:Uncharacterized protein n=1 Tax=Adineta ricciae TaxID=249248 RepID=A0A815TBW7_ADIRI|nr:unnamed protein product [Adineta ricciae]